MPTIPEEEICLNPTKFIPDASDLGHKKFCLAALQPLKRWLLVFPALILKFVVVAILFPFVSAGVTGMLEAVISAAFLFIVVYKDIVMTGVVNFIDLVQNHKGDQYSSEDGSTTASGMQSLHPQYFYILQQACFKVIGEALLFLYLSVWEQVVLSSASHGFKVFFTTVPFVIFLLCNILLRPLYPLNVVRYVCVLVSLHTSSNFLCSLSLFYLTLVLELMMAILFGVTRRISMTKQQWASCAAFLIILGLVPIDFYAYLKDSDVAPLTSSPAYCICTLGLYSASPDFPVRRLSIFILFSAFIVVKYMIVLWYSARTAIAQQLSRVSRLPRPDLYSNPNAVNWTGSMLTTSYHNIMGVIPAQVEWEEGWRVRHVEGYWYVVGIGKVYWSTNSALEFDDQL